MTKETVQHKSGLISKTKDLFVKAIDANGNGQIDLEDIIIKGLQVPGVKVHRGDFLQKQFQKYFPQEVIDLAIAQSPMKARVLPKKIDEIADEVIKYERNCVSGISTALGSIPFGAIATAPADIVQYYGYMLRTMQKLMYLYGFPQIDIQEEGQTFDDATMNTLIICFGVMNGVAGANMVIQKIANALANGVSKQLMKKALTKGTVYPIVKSISKWFGVKMTKEVFSGFFKKAIPVVGGVIGGGITYLSFKPCCDKLKKSLQNTILSNPDYKPEFSNDEIIVEDVED